MKYTLRTNAKTGQFVKASLSQHGRTIAIWWTSKSDGKVYSTPENIEHYQRQADQVCKAGTKTRDFTSRITPSIRIQEVTL